MTTIVRIISARSMPQFVVRAEPGSSVSVTDLNTNRVHYIKREADGEFDCGGLVPSSQLAKFMRGSWAELDAATASTS
jgi:hypothetical protein